MKLRYDILITPDPIKLSIGLLKKPALRDISRITFEHFSLYEALLRCTPMEYYTKMLKDSGGLDVWDSMSDKEKDSITMYDVIRKDKMLQTMFVEIFDFFFEENVRFKEDFFILYRGDISQSDDVPISEISGIISEQNFQNVLYLIQQVCCIYSEEEHIEDVKFKNDIARKLYEKMMKANKEKKETGLNNPNKNLSLPNIISSVSAFHPSINLINIWDLTLFQLIDAFKHIQFRNVYESDKLHVAVWGDDKKQFNFDGWYKNLYDNID